MDDLQEHLAHFHPDLSAEIKEFATEIVFRDSRYIFTTRKGKRQFGYCTHCGAELETTRLHLKHNDRETCPSCKSVCVVKASGISRGRLFDEAYFVYYEKSLISKQAIVARGIYAIRDYTGDYRNVETQYLVRAMYIFDSGSSTMLERYGYWSQAKTMERFKFNQRKTVFSLAAQYMANSRQAVVSVSIDSIKQAVERTPFQYSTWESYKSHSDMVKFFSLYANYPGIEHLTKQGFAGLIDAKLYGRSTYGAINWKGKTASQMLRLTKGEIRELRESNIPAPYLQGESPLIIRLMQISKKDQSNLSLAEISGIADTYGCYIKELQKMLKYANLRKINAFVTKQLRKGKDHKHYYGHSGVLYTWRDYINDCTKLEMDLTNERVLFPGDLYRAHQATIKQVKYKEDEILSKQIAARMKAIEKYRIESGKLFIRPAASSKELIDEGKALEHCVGGYAERYARGETAILFVRKKSKPDKPFYTMEVRQEKVVQVRGLKNCDPTKEVADLVEQFKAAKLTKQTEDNRIRVAVPA